MLKGIKNPPPRNERVTWCGPSALSIITGEDYETCRKAIAATQGNRPVMRVHNWQMIRVLHEWGFNTVSINYFGNEPTLAAWMREREPAEINALFLVQITGHYVVVQGRKACDSKTKEPVFLSKMPGRRARVEKVWKVAPAVDRSRERFVKEAERQGVSFQLDPQGTRLTIIAGRGKTFGGEKRVTFTRGVLWDMAASFLARHASGQR